MWQYTCTSNTTRSAASPDHQRSSLLIRRARVPRPMTRLPPELILCILSFLQDDKPALSACSLCCSFLTTASKPLLFHTLRTCLNSKAAERFEHLLVSDPTVLPFIKKIDVAVSTFGGADSSVIVAISRIVARCHTPPALNVLLRSNSHQSERLILPLLGPVLNWVTSLELEGLNFNEDVRFWDFVLTFSGLKSLVLGCATVGNGGADIPSPCELGISHLSLKPCVSYGHDSARLFLVDYPVPLPSLSSLDVRFPLVPSETFIRVGRNYGRTVRTLRFGVMSFGRSTMRLDRILACKS